MSDKRMTVEDFVDLIGYTVARNNGLGGTGWGQHKDFIRQTLLNFSSQQSAGLVEESQALVKALIRTMHLIEELHGEHYDAYKDANDLLDKSETLKKMIEDKLATHPKNPTKEEA